jgi:phage shock protein A
MSFFSNWRSSRASAPGNSSTPADQLHAEIAALETEMMESQRKLMDLEARSHDVETRAIEAIRSGDDWTARTVLREQHSLAEQAAQLTADLKVLRAILAECHEFVDARSNVSPPP